MLSRSKPIAKDPKLLKPRRELASASKCSAKTVTQVRRNLLADKLNVTRK